ncbi:MAG: hypothetical protein AAFV95_27785 [Bacteroidota bacterium]
MHISLFFDENNEEDKKILKMVDQFSDDVRKTPYTPVFTRTLKRLLKDATNEFHEGKFYLERSIEFPSQVRLAGLNLLAYYADRLERKYKDENLKVILKQDDQIVTLRVISENEEILEDIELDLEAYGEVLSNKRTPRSFIGNNDVEMIRLNNSLRMAEIQIDTEKSINQLQRGRVDELEKQNNLLNEYLGTLLQLQNKSFEITEKVSDTNLILNKAFFDSFNRVKGGITNRESLELLERVEESYVNGDIVNDKKKVQKYLIELKEKDKSAFEKIKKLGYDISNSAAGNYLMELLGNIF